MAGVKFSKWEGAGNDFILIDEMRKEAVPAKSKARFAIQACARHSGIGADGVLFISKSRRAAARMRVFNPDGSEPEMCGNGVRCAALYLKQKRIACGSSFKIETPAGLVEVQAKNGLVRVKMPTPKIISLEELLGVEGQIFKYSFIDMGNPHAVIFALDVSKVPLSELGPKISAHPRFPNRANVHFAQVLSRSRVKAIHWERGAGATLACGTGACAVAAASHFLGKTDSSVDVLVPGGVLKIELEEKNKKPTACFMTGPARKVFDGVLNV